MYMVQTGLLCTSSNQTTINLSIASRTRRVAFTEVYGAEMRLYLQPFISTFCSLSPKANVRDLSLKVLVGLQSLHLYFIPLLYLITSALGILKLKAHFMRAVFVLLTYQLHEQLLLIEKLRALNSRSLCLVQFQVSAKIFK